MMQFLFFYDIYRKYENYWYFKSERNSKKRLVSISFLKSSKSLQKSY